MDQRVWRFSRGPERLDVSRAEVDDGVMLEVAGAGTPRSYFFRDVLRLEVFQRDMETLLLKTGWTFDGYAPNRRLGRDRRGWPRKTSDRRRWWTDGAAQTPDSVIRHQSAAGAAPLSTGSAKPSK